MEIGVEGLKAKLRRLVDAIADGGDGCDEVETYDEVARLVLQIRGLKFGAARNGEGEGVGSDSENNEGGSVKVPDHFLCPLSSELMRDPVVLSSGQTYDRRFIQEWLSSGNRTCPKTQQVLSNITLTPNYLVRGMISNWCTKNGVSFSPPSNTDLDLVTGNDRSTFTSLLDNISSPASPISEKRQAVRDLRLLTKRNKSFRAVIGEKPGAISQFLSVLSVPGLKDNPEVLEDTVTTILNLSIHDSNKKILGEHADVVPILIMGLKSGAMETRSNSAAALFSLSALDSNKEKIGGLCAIKYLIELLEDGTLEAQKDAAAAIFSLCVVRENRGRAVQNGIVDVALKNIKNETLLDESLAILALLCSDQEAAEKLKENGVLCLLKVARENPGKRNKENAVVVLFSICMYDRKMLRVVGEDEKLNGTMAWLALNGTSRAQRKAAGILEKIKRTKPKTPYSC
ncbi:U-box domain-containing protein 9 [Rhynchospora pubera]|uniref:RING-type E3 ubiquitin transferase n=1 Tax=Rhynchospora pubera TaxID=906938 RepID=A0AAV8FBK5_9POAL|nr:U-box domain-containing protein 9 [Rhynchospora pubera]